MNKKGQEEFIGWVLVVILVITILFGIFSSNICNRILIGVGISGLIWMFFGNPSITRVETRGGFVFFLPLTIVLFIIWIILKATGICIPITEIAKNLVPTG